MATASQTKTTPSLDGLFERTTQAQDTFTDAARTAGQAYLDSYEKAVDRAIDLELRFAESTHTDWIKSIATTQTDLARELTQTYVGATRTMLK